MECKKVLQLGDLRIESKNSRALSDRLHTLLEPNAYDAIVICGNLTADGAAESFRSAGFLLDGLRPMLTAADGEHWRRRILLAPGPSDRDPTGSRTTLGNFYSFLTDWQDEQTSPGDVTVRVLKDFSLLGACFLGPEESAGSESAFARLKERLSFEIERRRKVGVGYFVHGPVLLATWASPLLDPVLRTRRWSGNTRETFHYIDLYLFGRGLAAFLPSEPFCFAPASVGLGPSPDQDPGHISMNVLQFARPSVLRPEPAEPTHLRATLRVLAQSSNAEGRREWAFDYVCKPHPPIAYSDEAYLSRRFLEKLENELRTKYLINVIGYGQVWRKVVANGLGQKTRLGDRAVNITGINISEYPKPSASSRAATLAKLGWFRELQRLKAAAESSGRSEQTVLVISDDAFSSQDYNRIEVIFELQKTLVELCSDTFRMIYLVTAYEMPRDFRSVDRRIGSTRMEPIDRETFETLVVQNSLTAPVDTTLMKQLSGGYVGFASLFLDAVRDGFQQWDRNRLITRQSRLELARDALEHSPELRRETSEFYPFVQTYGRNVARLIVKRLRDLPKDDQLLAPLTITRQEFEQAGIRAEDLAPWTSTGILAAPDTATYVLKERIPFLVHFMNRAKPLQVFIGYAESDHADMAALSHELKRRGFAPVNYKIITRFKSKIDVEIRRMLRESAAVVIIWTDESIKSQYVIREAKLAADPADPKLLNWYNGVQPPSVRDRIESSMSSREMERNGRILEAFKDYLGKFTLEEVVDALDAQLRPFTLEADELEEACAGMYKEA